MDIHWYPGHMTKTRRQLEKLIKLVDIVVELCDARMPMGSRNPDFDDLLKKRTRVMILNKEDLADPVQSKRWCAHFEGQGMYALLFRAQTGNVRSVIDTMNKAAMPIIERYKARGMNKTVRAMIVGIPNVGKSTFVNRLFGGKVAKVGNKPGVTRASQWVKVDTYLEVLDTPGMLWPKLADQEAARHLAMIGSIRDEIMDVEELAALLLQELMGICPDKVMERFKMADSAGELTLLESVCKGRGFLLSGGRFDTYRAANIVLEEFRSGKIARISLERPAMDEKTE